MYAYTCSFAAFFIKCVFAEGLCYAEGARIMGHCLQSTGVKILFIIIEDKYHSCS